MGIRCKVRVEGSGFLFFDSGIIAQGCAPGHEQGFGFGFRASGLGFGVWGLKIGVWGLGFGVWGLGFGVWGFEVSDVGPKDWVKRTREIRTCAQRSGPHRHIGEGFKAKISGK